VTPLSDYIFGRVLHSEVLPCFISFKLVNHPGSNVQKHILQEPNPTPSVPDTSSPVRETMVIPSHERQILLVASNL